jgi:two-component system, response regulator
MSRKNVILLVEDNPDDEVLTLRAFKKSGLANEIVVARDGVEALDLLHGDAVGESNLVEPALILLDLKLPKIDGLEVLRRVRSDKRTSHIPVVVLTTSSEESDIISSYQLGTNSYVRKPVNFDEFFEAVKQLGMYWFVLNQMPPQRLGSSGSN